MEVPERQDATCILLTLSPPQVQALLLHLYTPTAQGESPSSPRALSQAAPRGACVQHAAATSAV